MLSPVYFIDLRATYKENLFRKLERLLAAANLPKVMAPRELVAVKLHFGELGNAAFIRPVYLRCIVDAVKASGGIPFLTDANTLYSGTRSDAPSHLQTAIRNGFAYSVVDAPTVIADGLRGRSETMVPVNLKHFEKVHIASEISAADSMVTVSHFKGHELSGFGGALKNLGMGCASRSGKLAQHSSTHPAIKKKRCIGCGECEAYCAQSAIELIDEKAHIDPETCVGCGECILVCPQNAIQVHWNQVGPEFLERMVEYAKGAISGKAHKSLFVNFITDISPGCDCLPYNDVPIVPDVGILAATDPVAIDQASVDLVNQQAALPGSCLTLNREAGKDKIRGIYPKVDWEIQLAYAEKIGLGSRAYELQKA